MPTPHNEMTASVWLQYAWHRYEGPDPIAWSSADAWGAAKEQEARVREALMAEVRDTAPSLDTSARSLHERFGVKPRVREQRAKVPAVHQSTWPGWYEPRDMIAIAMGAPEPRRINGMWWHDRDHRALEHITCARELAMLKVPDWHSVECVQRMLDSRERWPRERPDEPAPSTGLFWGSLAVPGRGEVSAICYPSYVDLGLYLMGATRFLTVLGGEPELADAFMQFCFELSVSYTEFLLALKPEPFVGLCGFGGDATFFLPPDLYERYSAAWDARLFEHVRARHDLPADTPCNLHSCGASAHLYDSWAHHPCLGSITAVQTRLIPGMVERLRTSLPDVELELTLHPPQFDLVAAEPAAIRDVMRESAAAAGGRNVHFGFIATAQRIEDVPRLERNVEIVLEEMGKFREESHGNDR